MKKGKITRNRKPYDTGAIYLRMTPIQQLNYFRDLYYDNGNLTERCIIANAINDILLQYYRQAAEIEEYRKCIKEICKGIHETKALVVHDIQKARTEAIKEFAENFKQCIKNHRLEMNLNGLKGTHRTDEMTYETVIEYIDTLVKEMVGE